MIVLAMLMSFAVVVLHWGIDPGVAISMTVALAAAAAKIVKGIMRES